MPPTLISPLNISVRPHNLLITSIQSRVLRAMSTYAALLRPFVLQQTSESVGEWPFFPIYVGSNPKPFSMSMDTGSSITWLYSPLLPSSIRHGRNTYDPPADVSFRSTEITMRYGDGLVVDFDRMYRDKLSFGSTTQGDQLIFQASSVEGQNGISQSILMEGIFALKPRYDAESTSPTVWAKLGADLPEPVILANLKFNDSGKYVFGKIPYRKEDVKFWGGDVEEKEFWRLPVTSYVVGRIGGIKNGADGPATKTDFKAIVDTGTKSLCLPSDIVRHYYFNVPGHIQKNGQHLVPSDQMLPDLVLYIGEECYPVRIPGQFLKPQGSLNEPFCQGRLEESTNPFGPILGHPFLFAQNVIFKGIDVLSVGLVEKGVEECG